MKHPLTHVVLAITLVGSFLIPSILPAGEGDLKVIYVVTDDQKLFAWEGNELVYEFDMVSGRPGKETHPGVFHISRKYEDYTSKKYGSEMPYTMFFTVDGKAGLYQGGVSVIPEPGTMVMLITGALGLLLLAIRRRRRTA